jgi:hypothetical protein
MSIVRIDEKDYHYSDLDCNGRPYPDAKPLGSNLLHWPFIPGIGETIVIEAPDFSKMFGEIVHKVDMKNFNIEVEKVGVAPRHWCFCSKCWDIGYRFSKYTDTSIPVIKGHPQP